MKIFVPRRLIACIMSDTCDKLILKTIALAPLAGKHLISSLSTMLAKVTTKNQFTLPKRIIEALGNPTHFEVEIDGNRLVLTPSRPGSASAVRHKLQALGLLENDITDAVAWARSNK